MNRHAAHVIKTDKRTRYVINDVWPDPFGGPGVAYSNWAVVRRLDDLDGAINIWRYVPGYSWEEFKVPSGQSDGHLGWPIKGHGKIVVDSYNDTPLEVLWVQRPFKP